MKKEWISSHVKENEKLKKLILSGSNKTSLYLPIYILRPEFIEEYISNIEKSFKDLTSNPYLKFSNYQEYRILSLIHILNKSKDKYWKNNDDRRMPISEEEMETLKREMNSAKGGEKEYTSQLLTVNNIIKSSFDLTSYVYLLEWLQLIYSKDDPSRLNIRDRPYFEGTLKKIQTQNLKFHPDLLNFKNNIVDPDDMDKYNKIMETIVIFIRQGKLEEAQKTAEYYNQSFLSAMINGGLPMNDFLIDKVEELQDLDFDLFPPFMKTKELSEIKIKIKNMYAIKSNQYENTQKIFDQVVGNPNWLLWFYSVYEACELNMNSTDKYSFQMKLLQSYISGNPSFIENNNFSIYDSIYIGILSMLNSKIIKEYTKENQIINYHFVEKQEPDFTKSFNKNVKGNDINDIINFVKSKEKFNEIIKTDFIIELELNLIQLHFIEFSEGNPVEYYRNLNIFLNKIIDTVLSTEFENYLRIHVNTIDSGSQQKKELKLSQNELQQRNETNIKVVRLNYLKLIFLTIISYYSTNKNRFQIDDNNTNNVDIVEIIKQVYKTFDDLISIYFTELTQFVIRLGPKSQPENLIYIQCFALDLNTVQANLTDFANSLNDFEHENYKNLVKEIDIHFPEYQEQLNTNIANNTRIYEIPTNVASIDDNLERDLKQNYVISLEDENKINQIKFLFADVKLENITIFKYILKLSLKYLTNNKFYEALKINNEFHAQLDIVNILGVNFVKDNNLLKDELNFLKFLEDYSDVCLYNENVGETFLEYGIDMSHIGIYFTVLLTKQVLNCYFNFLNLVKNIFNEIRSSDLPQFSSHSYKLIIDKSNEIVNTFKIFTRMIRVLMVIEELRDVLINLFGDDVYLEEINQIISKWIFQIIKWIVDMYTQETFRKVNLMKENSLELISEILNIKEDVLLKHYVIERNYSFLETERSFLRHIEPNQRKKIPDLLFKLVKINNQFLTEIFDDELHNDLTQEINNYSFNLI